MTLFDLKSIFTFSSEVIMHQNSTNFLIGGGITQLSGAGFPLGG